MPKNKKTKTMTGSMPDVNDVMRYEQGEMEEDEMVRFFQGLIDSGLAWQLQGHYGRTAKALIEHGYCKE